VLLSSVREAVRMRRRFRKLETLLNLLNNPILGIHLNQLVYNPIEQMPVDNFYSPGSVRKLIIDERLPFQ
jgi:hypothetical protein